MKTQKNSNSASFNGDIGATRYVLRGPDGQFVASFQMSNWTHVSCDRIEDALMFVSMTQALAVGFCLGFGTKMAAIPYQPHQLNIPFKIRNEQLAAARGV